MIMPLTDHPKVGSLTADLGDYEDFLELIQQLKDAGTAIPEELQREDMLKQAINEKRVTRYTLMGKTIGIGMGEIKLMRNAAESL